MKKKINAVYYFWDIGFISIVAIMGFASGINKLSGILAITAVTLLSIAGTVHLQNKYGA